MFARFQPFAAWWLIGFAMLANVAYLLTCCPFDLAPDEAHYWDWSRRLDWSYYSKGPLVAWMIHVSYALVSWIDPVFAVRLPAIVCHGVLLAAIARLARTQAIACVAAAIAVPPLAAGAVLMTIDAPFLAAWAWALVAVRTAIFEQRKFAWDAAGLLIAVGTLAKYTMLAFPVSVLLYHVATRQRIPRGYWRMLSLGSLGLVPILVWNAQHDWVSVQHLFGQAGLANGPTHGFKWFGPVDYCLGQFGLLVGYWFLVWLAAVVVFRGNADPQLQFLWWFSVPLVLAFVPISLRAKVQPNWPAPAYISGLILCVAWLQRYWTLRIVRTCFGIGLTISVTTIVLMRFPQLALPIFSTIVPQPSSHRAAPVRNLDPTARLRGWKHLAHEVDRVREQVKQQTGQDAELAAMVWTVPGELAFYCAGNPQVYTFGPCLADRASQYDLWRPNPVLDAQAFAGRTFIYVGEEIPGGDRVFEQWNGPIRVDYRENGVTVGSWKLWLGTGYRGFTAQPNQRPRY